MDGVDLSLGLEEAKKAGAENPPPAGDYFKNGQT